MITLRKLSDANNFLSIFLMFSLVIISVPFSISAENGTLVER
jgi:hypothetical protein